MIGRNRKLKLIPPGTSDAAGAAITNDNTVIDSRLINACSTQHYIALIYIDIISKTKRSCGNADNAIGRSGVDGILYRCECHTASKKSVASRRRAV